MKAEPKQRGRFRKGDSRTKEIASAGGRRKAELAAQARRTDAPYTGTIIDMMDAVGLSGPDWYAWRVFWKAVFGLTMDEDERSLFQRHTERENPPSAPVLEAWMPIGRRGGKSRNAAMAAVFMGIRFDATRLAPGETALVPIIAVDKKQGRQALGYAKGILALPEFKRYVRRELSESVELNTGVVIEVATGSYRTIRGYTVIGTVADEIAFWRTDDGSANPDSEILQALRPGMATVGDALLLGLSNPYAARGELYKAVERSFGIDDPHTLVWNSDSRGMHPSLPAYVVERAFEDDPVSALSEYGQDGRVHFRRDVEVFLDPEAIKAVTLMDVREIPPQGGKRYFAFVDPSGGSQDSMTLAIAHADGKTAVLDCVREVRPPFSPDSVVQDFAALLKSYWVQTVRGDRYAGEWPRERFRVHGITYKPSDLTKSDLYREIVAPINGCTVSILDHSVLRAQLIGLERRVARGGKDSIDHARGSRDDVANAAVGALVGALGAAHRPNTVRVSKFRI